MKKGKYGFCLKGGGEWSNPKYKFFFPHVPTKLNVGKVLQFFRGGSSKSWRGFVDKTDIRLAPGSVQLYCALVYSTAVLLGAGKGDYRTIGINFWGIWKSTKYWRIPRGASLTCMRTQEP